MVGRPRVVAIAGWCVLLAIGVYGLVRWTGAVLVVGALFALLGMFGLISTLWLRVWVSGGVLHYRTLRGYRPVVRLDRLTTASLTPFGADSGRQLRLADADGASVQLDATNMRIERLYPMLAQYLRHDDDVANDLLQRRMARYRPDFPLGPS
ncbi:hypothetical protein AB0M20_28370 [Actinoplanes sp. NPDC051633]|uniref:hypothetical protein n=1 Tax=Actinoplanes sp. NPDC051633 TaxID=3155670 RepID=UPI00343B3C56